MKNDYLNILGVRCHPVNIPLALQKIDKLVKNGEKGHISATGVHGIMESQKSNYVKEAHNNSFLTVPDGMPLVYIGKMSGFSEVHNFPFFSILVLKRALSLRHIAVT